jgi:hypothetical protein
VEAGGEPEEEGEAKADRRMEVDGRAMEVEGHEEDDKVMGRTLPLITQPIAWNQRTWQNMAQWQQNARQKFVWKKIAQGRGAARVMGWWQQQIRKHIKRSGCMEFD